MTVLDECLEVTRAMLARAGVAPEAWSALRYWMKRAAVARALGTDDAATIDKAVEMANWCLRAARPTGDLANVGAGVMGGLLFVGGSLVGIAAALAYQKARVEEMSDAEYGARVDNAESDWRRYGTRYATIAEVTAGGYRSNPSEGIDANRVALAAVLAAGAIGYTVVTRPEREAAARAAAERQAAVERDLREAAGRT